MSHVTSQAGVSVASRSTGVAMGASDSGSGVTGVGVVMGLLQCLGGAGPRGRVRPRGAWPYSPTGRLELLPMVLADAPRNNAGARPRTARLLAVDRQGVTIGVERPGPLEGGPPQLASVISCSGHPSNFAPSTATCSVNR